MARNLILGVFPELTAVGGIQQVSRHIGAALEEIAARKNLHCELLALNDRNSEGRFEVGGREYRFRGFARNKFGLLAHLTLLARRTRLIFASHVNLGPLALWVNLIQGQAKFWIAVHGVEVWEPLPLVRRVALRKANGIMAVSRHTGEMTANVQAVLREKIAVLSPALDPQYAMPEPVVDWPVPPGSKVLLTVGRLLASEPGKGVDTVIRALPQLLNSFPNLHYVVIGDGDARPALERLAAECGVAERVHFSGSRTGALRGYFEAADVFVMPSRQEGFGIAFLEAMAAARPVVGAACGGATEVIVDGETGFLIEYGDVPALATRLATLLVDDGLRQRMGEAGRRIAEERYQFEQFRERLISILRKNDA
jgi:phosphatidylinositol alpha-1,6-mannosyltransferase